MVAISRHQPEAQRQGRAKNADKRDDFRLTVTNDKAGQATLKLIRQMVSANNDAEKTKASKTQGYTPRLVHTTVVGRIGRNLLFGPRYKNRPAGRDDRSQDKHTAPPESAVTLDVYLHM